MQVPFLFVVFLVVIIFVIDAQDSKQINLTNVELADSLQEVVNEQRNTLTRFINTNNKHLQFLADTPPVLAIHRALANSGTDPNTSIDIDILKSNLSIIFKSLINNYSDVFQVRMIDAISGNELVRVDKYNNKISEIKGAKLQNKRETDYFSETIKLSERGIYISEINLNRENGTIEYPIRPTIRFATPLFDETNTKFAILVINVSPVTLFSELHAISKNKGSEFSLLDNVGNVVTHEKEQYQFTKDLNPELNWKNLYEITPWESSSLNSYKEVATTRLFLGLGAEVHVSPDIYGGATKFTFVNYLPKSSYNKILKANRQSHLLYLVVVLLVFIITSWIFLSYLRKAAALKKTRTEFEAIFQGASDGIIAIDTNLNIISFNYAATHFFNDLRHVNGKLKLTDLKFDSSGLTEDLQLATKINNGVAQTEIEVDGVSLRIATSPILNEGKNLLGRALFIQDISAQKKFEVEVKKLNTSLEGQIQDRTLELENERKKAVDASSIKSAFVSNISHEMRTPLNGILGALNLVMREKHTNKVKTLLSMMDTSAKSLSNLISDVLDLSKIEARKLDLKKDSFNPIQSIEEVVSAFSPQAHKKNIDIDLDVTGIKFNELYSDVSRFSQIFNNLLDNAVKFTVSGGVYISAKTEEIDNDIKLIVEVTDTGIGIDEEEQTNLFQAFMPSEHVRSNHVGGTGLGLSISYQLCQILGGEVTLESIKGKGSVFRFYILSPAVKSQKLANIDILAGKSFRVDLSNQFIDNKWRNIIAMFGGTVVNQLVDDQVRTNDTHNTVHTDDNMVDYFIVDKQHSMFAQILKEPQRLSKCIVLSKHSEPHAKIEGVFGYLGRPTKLISFIDLFDTDQKIRHVFHRSQNSGNESSVNFPALADKHFLVVDDNNINVEIASHLLRLVKGQVKTAVTGLDAINVLNKLRSEGQKIDLILMDCQMPEMDGYESTRRIRSGEAGLEFADIPIVALTANALAGERTKCINVGMNEYLTKPIVAKKLFSTLSEVLNNPTTPAKSGLKTVDKITIEDDVRFAKDKALERVMGDETLFKELLDLFVKQTRVDIDGMFKLLKQKDFIHISHLCHSLKGAASNIGANKFYKLCFELELASGSTDVSNCSLLLQNLEDEFVALEIVLNDEVR